MSLEKYFQLTLNNKLAEYNSKGDYILRINGHEHLVKDNVISFYEGTWDINTLAEAKEYLKETKGIKELIEIKENE